MTFYNVARWSVFGAGITYGFLHNRTLAKQAAGRREEAAEKKQQKLVEEARAQWNKLHPKPAQTGPVLDIDSPDFDPVKAIDWKVKQLDA